MYILKKIAVFYLLLLSISFIPIIFVRTTYKHVLSVFPSSPELEIPFYYIVTFCILSLYSFLYWFSFTSFFEKVFNLFKGKFIISRPILLIIILLEIFYIFYFANSLFTQSFRKNLYDLGIQADESFSLILLFVLTATTTILLFLLTYVKNNKKGFIFYCISLIFIIIFSFNLKNLNPYDYSYFAGPINDVLHGKYLLSNVRSQYGFLSILFLSIPFHFSRLSLINITILNSVAVTFGFFLTFIIIQQIYKNKFVALFATLSIILINFVIQIIDRGRYPQTSFLRFGPWTIFTLLLYLNLKHQISTKVNKFKLLLLSFLTFSFFWILDNGIYMVMAYLTFVFFININSSIFKTLKNLLIEYAQVFVFLLTGFIFITLIYNVILKVPINWNYYLFDSQYYFAGFGLVSFPNSFIPWIMILGYLLMLAYFFYLKRYKSSLKIREKLTAFILFYGIFQFTYFVGRSHLNNLHHVAIPFLICFFYFFDKLFSFLINNDKVTRIIFLLSFSLFISIPVYFIFFQSVLNYKNENILTTSQTILNKQSIEEKELNNLFEPSTISRLEKKYYEYINKNGIILISRNDTWYLVNLNKTNNIDSNNLQYFLEENDWNNIADSVINRDDKYIFIDTNKAGENNPVAFIYQKLKDKYPFKENIGSLDVLEKP